MASRHATQITLEVDDRQVLQMFNKFSSEKPERLRIAMINSMREVGLTAVNRFMNAARLTNYNTGFTIGTAGSKLNVRSGRLARSLIGGFSSLGAMAGEREGIRKIKTGKIGIEGIFGTTVPYGAIHEYGGETHPTVTAKMRRWAWAMWYLSGKTLDMYKGIALTRKSQLDIRIPARPYLEPAVDRSRLRVFQFFQKAINDIIEESGGG